MKILYLITGLGGGGAEKVVADLADQMSKRGHQVKIAYLKGEKQVVSPTTKNIELIYLGFESASDFYFASKKYCKLVQDFEPDVVHSHMVHANIFARLNRLYIKIPKLICTAHNANEGGKFRMLMYRLTNFLSEINTNVSVEAVESFIHKKAFNNDAIAIYNGIDLKKFKFIGKNNNTKKRILAVGRLNAQKDYPNLLKALSMMPNKNIFKLLIAGEGEEREKIEKLILTYKLDCCVELLGRREDIPELFKEADFFVLSSAFEGFGLVVAEAMACNTFVVGTDCGGVKEVMGGTGILVSPRDSTALSEALVQAINMPNDDIIQNNIKAFEHVKRNFDLQIIVEKWLELYAS